MQTHRFQAWGNQALASGFRTKETNHMNTTITAAVARTHKAPLSIETLHLDDIRPNEARVRLVVTGVATLTPSFEMAFTLRRCLPSLVTKAPALSSRLERLVRYIKGGDHVILSAAYCTYCERCRSGDVAYCENLFAEDFGGRRTIDGTTSLRTLQGERLFPVARK
jgi:aryl-alcohol dehydrogenase